jgi:hypothetical protein
LAGLFLSAACGRDAPADDFLRVQPGPRLTLMPFIGPGFRAIYDHRFELEEEVTELYAIWGLSNKLFGTQVFR